MIRALPLLLALAVPAAPALAQPSPEDRAVTEAVLKARDDIRAAAGRKDKGALERLIADNFQHLRDTGRMDLKGDRIGLLVAGEGGIETAPEEEFSVHTYGPGTAAVTGTSVVTGEGGKAAPFRWLQVYVRQGDAWRLALSQASRVVKR